MISHAEVVWDDLNFKGETYKFYGLTGVLTYPAERHKGYGRQIVTAATEYINATDADFAIVNCAEHLTEFYASCGWLPMVNTQTLVGEPSQPKISEEKLLMRFYSGKDKRACASLAGSALYAGDSVW